MFQFGPRPALSEPGIAQRDARRVEGAPLAPAETLIEPETLRTIERSSVEGPSVRVVQGSDAAAGEIAVVCGAYCEPAEWALKKLGSTFTARLSTRYGCIPHSPEPVAGFTHLNKKPQPGSRGA